MLVVLIVVLAVSIYYRLNAKGVAWSAVAHPSFREGFPAAMAYPDDPEKEHPMRHRTGRPLAAAGFAALLVMAAPAANAASPASEWRAEWRGWLSDGAGGLRDGAERAIILGGALLYQNRHMVAGLTLGCLAGGAMGATGAVAAGAATGGAALPATGPAAALGCALGAAAGGAMGRPLDQPMD